jgi:hypothetical protein
MFGRHEKRTQILVGKPKEMSLGDPMNENKN